MYGTCRINGGNEKFIQNSSWKIRRERPLGRSRNRWDDNIRIALK